MRHRHIMLLTIAWLLLPSALPAQQVNDGNKTGFPPFGSFHGSNFDQVGLQNGNLHIEIPATSVLQRGGRSFTYRFVYDTPTYVMQQFSPDGFTYYWLTNKAPNEAAGWRLVKPNEWKYNFEIVEQQCSYGQTTIDYLLYRNWTVADPNGTKHPLPHRYETRASETGPCYEGDLPLGVQLKGVALDGTGILLDATGFPSSSPKVYTKDGTRVIGLGGGRDANGNILVDSADMLNRTVLTSVTYPNHLQPQYTIWTVRNSAGDTQEFRVDYTSISAVTDFCDTLPPLYQDDDCFEAGAGGYLPTKLTLPNGKFYQFTWNATGDLTTVILPTGGSISYTYASSSYLIQPTSTELEKQGYLARRNARRHVLTRTVNDGQTSQQWTYNDNGSYGDGSSATVIVRDPLGNEQVHDFAEIGLGKYETELRTYQGLSTSGTLLRKVTKQYASEFGPTLGEGPSDGLMNARLIRETTTLEDNQVSKTETDYETFQQTFLGAAYTATRLNVTQRREYAFGPSTPGALQRKTTYAYLHPGNQPYLDRNITDRVTTTQVYDGSGALKAQSINEYDGYSTGGGEGIEAANAVQHDATNYGTGFIYRGNVTALKTWRNNPAAWLETRHLKYDTAGNILKTRDPLGHVTTFNYDNSWGDTDCAPTGNARAYLKSVTNALGHVTTSTYNSCTGTVATATDPNQQTTTYTYDFLNRQDITNLPDGGQMDLDYDETNRRVTSKVLRDAQSGSLIVSRATYDQLGRITLNEACEDGTASCTLPIKTETIFDGMGRVSKVSNPYRPGDTVHWTETLYDALGRVIKVMPPDGTAGANNVTTSYSGNMTTVTDQQGKQRRSWTDSLGRLIQVNEPGGAPPSLATPARTKYYYDALDNLTKVEQMGYDAVNPTFWRVRTFTYNSLSQLLTASNPESGGITYAYDNDGNLLTKTDARGITATHGYDALHRLTQKSYSDGTPIAQFLYDQSSVWGMPISNSVGRLSLKQTLQGSTMLAASIFWYDTMGRVLQEGACTPSLCGWSGFNTFAGYDLAGNLTSLTYPNGRKVTYAYDTASRLNQVRFDSFNGTPVAYNYLSSATYHPHGAPHVTTLGSGLVETNTYNNRLQPLQMTGVTGAFTYFNKQYNFYDASGRNNGNVMRIADQLNAGRSQNFTYDELNRLDLAYTDANSGADCWGLNHGYDIWANLLSASVTKCSAPMLSVSVNTQNRINGFAYDAAGNLTADGSHTYQWDAESRMKSLDTTGATYTYDANGNRVRKQVASDSTEYIYFGGQVIAERAANGDWSDYIFAGARRLAKADTFEDRIRTYGTYCSGCPWQWSIFAFPNAAGLNGYVIQSGDKLYLRQWQADGARGGPGIWFTDGSYTGNVTYDQDGQLSNGDTYQNQWHYRRIDLTPVVGKTVNGAGLITEGWTPPGSWEIYYQDIALVSSDGTVRSIYNRQKTVNLAVYGSPESTRGYEVNHLSGVGPYPDVSTNYYHGDHLSSSRTMSSYNGYPTWSATYLPFGQEHNPQPTTNHYKFTGKERDPESNLDYFGARYYASTSARFLSPDWSPTPVTVPFADFGDPQTLNLYSYSSSPVVFADMDGHSTLKSQRQYAVAKAWERERAMVARTGVGTRPWTPEEKAELLRTGRVRGYEGHHIKSVNGHPEMARNPNNIKFVKGRSGHLSEHGGSFRNQTTGSLISRGFAALQILDLIIQAVIADRSKEEGTRTGFYEDIGGRIVITDLARAGQHLEVGTQINYGGVPGTGVGWIFTLQENGTWIDKDGNRLIQDKNGNFKVVGPEA